MAMTRSKLSYSVNVTTIKGTTATAADSATSNAGQSAYQAFMAKETLVIPNETNTLYIPFHAIDNIVVTITSGNEEYTDSTCAAE